jgi:hypothetical protein
MRRQAICGRTVLQRSTVMTAFIHPIAWFLGSLRRWRDSERRTLAASLPEEATPSDLDRRFNTLLWFLPPPC